MNRKYVLLVLGIFFLLGGAFGFGNSFQDYLYGLTPNGKWSRENYQSARIHYRNIDIIVYSSVSAIILGLFIVRNSVKMESQFDMTKHEVLNEKLQEDPLKIARIRFASGEITSEEYDDIKNRLAE